MEIEEQCVKSHKTTLDVIYKQKRYTKYRNTLKLKLHVTQHNNAESSTNFLPSPSLWQLTREYLVVDL